MVRPRRPFCDASTASAIVRELKISTRVLMPASVLDNPAACSAKIFGEPLRKMMYVASSPMKNITSLARKSQMATFPGGVGSPCPITGSGACSSGTQP